MGKIAIMLKLIKDQSDFKEGRKKGRSESIEQFQKL